MLSTPKEEGVALRGTLVSGLAAGWWLPVPTVPATMLSAIFTAFGAAIGINRWPRFDSFPRYLFDRAGSHRRSHMPVICPLLMRMRSRCCHGGVCPPCRTRRTRPYRTCVTNLGPVSLSHTVEWGVPIVGAWQQVPAFSSRDRPTKRRAAVKQ